MKNEILKMRIDSSLKNAFKGHCRNKGSKMSEELEKLIKRSILETSSK